MAEIRFHTREELRTWAGGPVVIESQGIACRGPRGASFRFYRCTSPKGQLEIFESEDGITVTYTANDV